MPAPASSSSRLATSSDTAPPRRHRDDVAPAARRTGNSPRAGRRHPRPTAADPTADAVGLAAAELEFLAAMQEYKQRSGRMFPTWSEVLEVLTGLGYRKLAVPGPGPTGRIEGGRS